MYGFFLVVVDENGQRDLSFDVKFSGNLLSKSSTTDNIEPRTNLTLYPRTVIMVSRGGSFETRRWRFENSRHEPRNT